MHNNFGRVSTYSFSLPLLTKFGPIELEDILHLPTEPSLHRLDSTLKRFISFCASYYGMSLHFPANALYRTPGRAIPSNFDANGACLSALAPVRVIHLPLGKDVR